MIRTLHFDVLAAANAEGLTVAVTGSGTVKKKVLRCYYETVAQMDFRAYVETDRIAEAAGELAAMDQGALEIQRDLADGETFRVGWNNGTAGPLTHAIAVQVEET